jgi:type IV pilus assembly protein PilC
MALYRYRALDHQGTILTGYLTGKRRQDILSQLVRMQLDPLKISRENILLFKKKPKDVGSVFFYLEILLKVNISLLESLSVLQGFCRKNLQDMVGSVIEDIRRGICFSDALGRYPDYFDSVILALVRVGEKTGRLSENIKKIRQHIEKQYLYHNQLYKALRYPLGLFGMFLVTLGVFCSWVIPEMALFLETEDQKTVFVTNILVSIGNLAWGKILTVFGGLIACTSMIYRLYLPQSRLLAERVFFSYMPFGKWAVLSVYRDFFMVLSTLCSSQLEFIHCLEIAQQEISSRAIQKQMFTITEKIKKGKSILEAFEQCPFLSPVYLKLMGLGERSGDLNSMISHIYEMMNQILEQKSQNFLKLVEPLCLLFVGFLLFLLINATFLPLYQRMGSLFDGL